MPSSGALEIHKNMSGRMHSKLLKTSTRLRMGPVGLTCVGASIHEPLEYSAAISGVANKTCGIALLYTRFAESQNELRLTLGRPQPGRIFRKVKQPEILDFLTHVGDRVAAEDAVRQAQQPEPSLLAVIDVELA